MKNILFIIDKLCDGGAEKSIINLTNVLKQDYNIKLLTFEDIIKDYKPEVPIINLNIPKSKNILRKIINVFRRTIKIRKIKKNLNIDVSISFLPGPNLINCLTKRKDKVIVSIRNTQSKLKKDLFRDFANLLTYILSDKVIAVSNMVKEDFIKRYKANDNKIEVIYNMVDLNRIEQEFKIDDGKEEIQKSKDKILINIGRLVEQKGQWHLIRVFKEIIKIYPNIKLVILGRGELEGYLRELIDFYNLKDKVLLLGFKENPYKYLKNSDIYISTSLYEGMSNTILEAMVCGLPVIATDCKSGTREILAPQTNYKKTAMNVEEAEYGILVPNLKYKFYKEEKLDKEEEKLKDAIITLLKDNKKYNNYKAQSKMRAKNFDSEIIKQKWKNIIEKI